MTNNNDYPSAEEQSRVLDSTHGIEHILEGQTHAYYPWYWDTEQRAFYYYQEYNPRIDDYSRVRRTSYGEAYNYVAEKRGLPGLPYPLAWERGAGKGEAR